MRKLLRQVSLQIDYAGLVRWASPARSLKMSDHGTYCSFVTLGSDVFPTPEFSEFRLALDAGCSLLANMIDAEVRQAVFYG